MAAKSETGPISGEDSLQFTRKIFRQGIDSEEVTHLYNEWSKRYDENLPPEVYGCPYAMQTAMKECFPTNRDAVTVLDVGCGTGLTGQVLREAGFKTVDGLDPARDMLREAEAKGIYRRLMNLYFTGDPTDLPADSYDAIVLVGVMHHGSIRCDAFEEMVRLVKPGGYIVNCVRTSFLQEVPEYREHWEPLVARLEASGKWRVVKRERYPHHYLQHEGECQVFQVL
ncbi:hypothetical protein BaRGS_00040207 [Batillaria attramentaria]|uniref:Methyltransferase type 11 domain-containing protein n=1 Tax=Batillaria attramentaria TaxID=370345 RepID=A0ABD0J121_9CAEN